jgi:hypothetical protein
VYRRATSPAHQPAFYAFITTDAQAQREPRQEPMIGSGSAIEWTLNVVNLEIGFAAHQEFNLLRREGLTFACLHVMPTIEKENITSYKLVHSVNVFFGL